MNLELNIVALYNLLKRKALDFPLWHILVIFWVGGQEKAHLPVMGIKSALLPHIVNTMYWSCLTQHCYG